MCSAESQVSLLLTGNLLVPEKWLVLKGPPVRLDPEADSDKVPANYSRYTHPGWTLGDRPGHSKRSAMLTITMPHTQTQTTISSGGGACLA